MDRELIRSQDENTLAAMDYESFLFGIFKCTAGFLAFFQANGSRISLNGGGILGDNKADD